MPIHHDRSPLRWNIIASLAVLMVGLLGAVPLPGAGPAQVAFPAAPEPGRFVVDEARLIAPLHQVDLEGIAGELKREHGYPVTIVTIRSLSSHGATGYTIERYASEMLKSWPPTPNGRITDSRCSSRPTIDWRASSSDPRGGESTTVGPKRSWTI